MRCCGAFMPTRARFAACKHAKSRIPPPGVDGMEFSLLQITRCDRNPYKVHFIQNMEAKKFSYFDHTGSDANHALAASGELFAYAAARPIDPFLRSEAGVGFAFTPTAR